MTSVPRIGFDRLPRDVHEVLKDATRDVVTAASLVHRFVETRDGSHLDALHSLELDGRSITRRLIAQLGEARLSSDQRSGLVALAYALARSRDALEVAAEHALSCDCDESTAVLAAITRDALRTGARTVQHLDEAEPRVEAISDLEHEARRVARKTRAETLMDDREPVQAIRRSACIERFERAFTVSVEFARAADRAAAVMP
jgi:hypothetical protein